MNLIDEAESLLLHQFSQSPKLKALLRALVAPFHDVDEQVHKLHHGGYIDNAKGASLGVIGNIVGQSRLGMKDEDYRPWIKVAICLNNGCGTPENVLAILRILFDKTPPIRLEEFAPNDVIVTFFEHPKFPLPTLFAIVRSAMPVNTKCQFVRAESTAAIGVHMLEMNDPLPPFRLDFTPFSACYFADFFAGES
jgi:hypothetical protein